MCTRTRIVQFLVTAAQASSDRARPVQIDPTLDPDPRLSARASRPAPPHAPLCACARARDLPGMCTRTRIVQISQISPVQSSPDQTSPDQLVLDPDPRPPTHSSRPAPPHAPLASRLSPLASRLSPRLSSHHPSSAFPVPSSPLLATLPSCHLIEPPHCSSPSSLLIARTSLTAPLQ